MPKKKIARKKKAKKKTGKPGPKPGHGGRPPIMTDPVARSVLLDETEWAQVVRLAPHGSWSSRIRQLITKAGRKK